MSVCGVEDKHLEILENKFNVSIYPKGNELTIKGDLVRIEDTIKVLYTLKDLYNSSAEITEQKVINIADNIYNDKENKFISMKIKLPYLGRNIEMKTVSQGEYLYKMQKSDIIFSTGAAGTGKTFLSVAYAINLLSEGKIERIIITRPVVEAGESLGYLPGDFKEKISPYMRPVYDALYSIISADMISRFTEEGKIEVAPLAYMRGRTLSRSFIILDEAQNTTISQMKMFLSRIGEKSKVVVTGDISQSDLPKNAQSGLEHALRILSNINGISFHHFEKKDVIRHHLVSKILEAYDNADY
ncbi:PhoH family protein [Brachyspira intermedia PWS/A]|uniref:PhoH-like protein n=1 Tax=Brachyspira intermedia (strain ATCC 51140 / PWS/A) TaxID=1045858 RepID=G0EIX5_BRAIP|nr:PhoH family protein [Brachyspira intermedia]AEM21052.1 PhoH family protein [Brachyspira intermedia PWS/A]